MKQEYVDKLVVELMLKEHIVDTTDAIREMLIPIYNGNWWNINREVVAYRCKHDSKRMQLGEGALRHYIRYHYHKGGKQNDRI